MLEDLVTMEHDFSIIRPFRNSNHQCFLQWFAQACEECGVHAINPLPIPWSARLFAAKVRISRALPFRRRIRNTTLIVPCCGYPDSFVFPHAYIHEIIPVLWDTWPRYHSRLIKSFIRHRVKLAFFTQKQVAEMVHEKLPNVVCEWMPEGINPIGYCKGRDLDEREINLLELGRLHKRFHDAIEGRVRNHFFRKPEEGLLFRDFQSLTTGIANSKITVCFPRCDTHPEVAGGIETLTQRYWECMLSRTVILGRAPGELIDYVGYDPVVNINWNDPIGQVRSLIANISDYQELVNRNFDTAQRLAAWKSRIPQMLSAMNKCYSTAK